jgi:HK97 family phage major capsid protein
MDIEQKHTEALNELRGVIEGVKSENLTYQQKLESLDGLDRAKFEKCQTALDAIEDKNEKLTLEFVQAKKEAAEFQERVEDLERQVVMASKADPVHYKSSDEFKAFSKFVQSELDFQKLPEDQRQFLRTDIGAQGGYLVPETYDDQLQKEVVEKTPALQLVRVRALRGVKTLNVRVRTGVPTAYWVGEKEVVTESKPAYRMVQMTAKALGVKTEITRDMLLFSSFNMESEVQADAVESFADEIGRVILRGNSTDNPQGILDSSAGVETVDSANSGSVVLDDILEVTKLLKDGYNGVLGFNRNTRAVLRQEKSTQGQYLWRPGAEGMPNQVFDVPYIIMNDMPDIAVDATPVVYGDFGRGYTVLDAMNLEVTRDNLTQADSRVVVYNWFRFMDGKVTMPEAFKLLKVKA